MQPVYRTLPVLAAVGLWLCAAAASAQQVRVGTPFHSTNSSYFENLATSWSLQGQGWNASFGQPSLSQPQFGGFNSGAGLSFGAAFLSNGVVGKFNFNFSQGSTQSLVSSTPTVTLQNGVPGYFSDTTQAPFVISYIPVVGGFSPVASVNPAMPPPFGSQPGGPANAAVAQALQRVRAQQAAMDDDQAIGPSPAQAAVRAQADPGPPALPQGGPRPGFHAPGPASAAARPQHDLILPGQPDAAAAGETISRVARATQSSAGQAVPSVAEARRLYQAQQHDAAAEDQLAEYLARARDAESLGKPAVARQYYRLALHHASAAQREEIQGRLEAITAESSGKAEE
jgi:hypothetical protein